MGSFKCGNLYRCRSSESHMFSPLRSIDISYFLNGCNSGASCILVQSNLIQQNRSHVVVSDKFGRSEVVRKLKHGVRSCRILANIFHTIKNLDNVLGHTYVAELNLIVHVRLCVLFVFILVSFLISSSNITE